MVLLLMGKVIRQSAISEGCSWDTSNSCCGQQCFQIGIEDDRMGPRAAVRWSLLGKHDGWGAYGAPSGAEVYIMGFTHANFGRWGQRAEHTVFDETAIWKQIILNTG